jgi:death on curing protein
MSKKINQVLLYDFKILLSLAQESHLAKKEPIPTPHKNSFEQIESCLQMPFQVVFGKVLYRGFVKKAAILFYLLVKNHLLENGNKRMACLALSFFCEINGYNFDIDENSYYELSKNVASSTDKDESLSVIESSLRLYLKLLS